MTPSRRSAEPASGTPAVPERRGGRRSQRTDIITAAVELFAKGGSRGTPLAAIAERIGVTAPAITHHFGTKEALLQEVVTATDRLDEVAVAPPAGATGMERLHATRSWGRVLVSDPALANLSRLSAVMTAEALDPEYSAHEHFVARNRRFRDQVRRLIELGQRDGSIRPDVDAGQVALEVISFMQGAGLQWFLDPQAVDLVAVYESYFDRLVAELSPERRRLSGGNGAKQRGGARSGPGGARRR